MGKILVASFLSVLASFSSLAVKPAAVDSVFICTGRYASTFHTDRSCSGLEECGQVVRKVPRSAVPKKRRLCKLCSKAAAKSSDASLKSKKKADATPKRKAKKAVKKKKLTYPSRSPLDNPFN